MNAREWRNWSYSVLLEQLEKQVTADGMHAELSSYYHCYTLDFYLQSLILADRNGMEIPRAAWKRVGDMAEVLMHMSRPDGTIPLLGDDDGGRALALKRTYYDGFQDGLCTTAVLFERGDMKYQAAPFREETLWLLGESAWETYKRLAARPPHQNSLLCASAGYVFQRSGWTSDAAHLIFDCGGMGMLTAGHSHADSLSVTLFAGEKDLLVDPGTYNYNVSRDQRNYFRSTRAHNTAVIDGEDQSQPGDTFRWNHRAGARLIKELSLRDFEFVEAEHDGYMRLPQGVIHRRRLLHRNSAYWLLVDDFRGDGEHSYELFYHLGPDATITGNGRVSGLTRCLFAETTVGPSLTIAVGGSSPIEIEIDCGAEQRGNQGGIQGWVSSRYGQKQPALTVCAKMRGHAPQHAITLLLPSAVRTPDSGRWRHSELPSTLTNQNAHGLTLTSGDDADYVIVAPPNVEVAYAGCEMRGELFWLHTRRGALRQMFAVNPTHLSFDGRSMLTDDEPPKYFHARIDANGQVVKHKDAGEKTYVRDLRHRELQRR